MKWQELDYQLITHARKGGKASRRRQTKRVKQFLQFCRSRGVRGPDQIGTAHVFEWYKEFDFASSTLRDRYYAICLLWELLGRGLPPSIDKLNRDN